MTVTTDGAQPWSSSFPLPPTKGGSEERVIRSDLGTEAAMPSPSTFGPSVKVDAIVDLRYLLEKNPAEAMVLFDKGFQIYCDCFPDPSERESRDTLLAYLTDPDLNWRMYLAIAKDGAVIGGRHINVMQTTVPDQSVSFAWEEHLYLDPDPRYRRQGIGSSLVQKTNEALRDFGVGIGFSEQNDPYLMTTDEVQVDLESGISPEQRLKFWNRLGYRALDVPYAQPTLDGGDPVYYLRLGCFIIDPLNIPEVVGFTGKSIDRGAYLSIIRSFHGTFVDDLERDSTSVYIRELVEAGPKEIPLIDIREPRTFYQRRIDLGE